MIEKSTVITESDAKSGIGKYAWSLYNLGIFEDFCHLSYKGYSDFQNHIYFTKRWGINTLYSYYFGGPYKKYVKSYKYVHASSPAHFHMIKYNKNISGTIHDFFPIKYSNESFVKSWFMKNIKYVPYLQGVITISNHIKKEAEERFKDVEFTTIHHWLDDKNYKPRDKFEVRGKLNLKQDKIYLLNVGRDVPRKNLDLLPKIMNKLDDRFILILITNSERLLPYFNRKENVIILKMVPEEIFPLYYNAGDLLIHTSIDGGFEYPYLEAMFSNLKIVTFDLPISREILRDKAIFIPFRDKNDPEDWIDAILKNYDKKPDYGDLINYYKPERARKDYENFYKKIGWL